MNRYGFVRISACSPPVAVANPAKNAEGIIKMLGKIEDSDIAVFPELCVTGYTCGDLFRQSLLLEQSKAAVATICDYLSNKPILTFIGAPVPLDNELYNCMLAIWKGKLLGIMPKINIPTYAEFYESRWFRSGANCKTTPIYYQNPFHTVPFGARQLFELSMFEHTILVGAETCEDLWMPIPPSSHQAMAGATILVNGSASNETAAKNEYRTDLVKNQSARCVAAYVYASAGPLESTTDLVFGGHCLIAENGTLLSESTRVGDGKSWDVDVTEGWFTTADVDVEKLQTERRSLSSFGEASNAVGGVEFDIVKVDDLEFCNKAVPHDLKRFIDGTPFVPKTDSARKARCAEIFDIQRRGLSKRLMQVGTKSIVIGVSGGLDSTLALLVAVEAFRNLKMEPKGILGITMPGFGTTEKTKSNATTLMEKLGISTKTVDIRPLCIRMFRDMGHKPFGIDLDLSQLPTSDVGQISTLEAKLKQLSPEQRKKGDLVFENVQARIRTTLLMSHGFVLGTGDMSELAVGWCTYNGDHMSMYNVNGSVPKTLVAWMVRYIAQNLPQFGSAQTELNSIADTVISPELLPPSATGEIEQSTEGVLGPYEIQEFFWANFVRNGVRPSKLLYLAKHAVFSKKYTDLELVTVLETTLGKFLGQQFKRTCVPDSPKAGSISLSPRGDWRMPTDVDPTMWMEEIRLLKEMVAHAS